VKPPDLVPGKKPGFSPGDLIRVKREYLSQPDSMPGHRTNDVFLIVEEFTKTAGSGRGHVSAKYYKLIKPDGMLVEVPTLAEWAWEIVS